MQENQNIEYKEIWKDEYFKQICAFANTNGGTLFVGINDNGYIIGITNTKTLLENIPNKAIQFLGITLNVNSITKNNKSILEIKVLQNSVPISYKGKYYIRSGSTVQEITGQELHTFILRKVGKSFDELSLDSASIDDINKESVMHFVEKATKTNRISINAINQDIKILFENLHLINEEGKLKNAAILLFGKNPLKFFSAVSFRIGKFIDNDYELQTQDVIEGNVFDMPDKVLEILKTKYLKYEIFYDGLQRIEKLEYPEEALREAVLNAIVHKDYTGVHIQLSIYNKKLVLWNEGQLPKDMTIESLKKNHPSKPRNIEIANVFFRSGYIETWGRGISIITNACSDNNLPDPLFEELSNGFQITLFKNKDVTKDVTKDVIKDVTKDVTKEIRHADIVKIIEKNSQITIDEIAHYLSVNRRTILRDLEYLQEKKTIKRIGGRKSGYWEVKK